MKDGYHIDDDRVIAENLADTHMSTKWQVVGLIVSAHQLRRYADISRTKAEKKRTAKANTSESALDEQRKLFMQSEFLERDSEHLKQNIIDAARSGNYAIEVMKFPSDFCSDGGRAINNSDKNWPETLQGKAQSFYAIWKMHGHPHGYRLTAKITDYPDGFIGDVSLLIDWS